MFKQDKVISKMIAIVGMLLSLYAVYSLIQAIIDYAALPNWNNSTIIILFVIEVLYCVFQLICGVYAILCIKNLEETITKVFVFSIINALFFASLIYMSNPDGESLRQYFTGLSLFNFIADLTLTGLLFLFALLLKKDDWGVGEDDLTL